MFLEILVAFWSIRNRDKNVPQNSFRRIGHKSRLLYLSSCTRSGR
jgi:hypothetical protein